jgi:hypothetical protein
MTFATYLMTFNQGKWLMRNLENSYPHVDKIYLMHSELPWGYKPDARKKYTNNVDLNIIKQSPYIDKIEIIEGDWLDDTGQRTDCLQRARKDGVDFLMVHDADEFYFHEDFDRLRKYVESNEQYDAFAVNLYAFWKSFKYVLIDPQRGRIGGTNQTIVNLHRVDHYDYIRDVHTNNLNVVPDIMQFHGSYVLTDAEVYEKVNSTSHSNDYDGEKWYKEVWLPWTLESRNLHPIWPWCWDHCEIFGDPLPEVIEDFDVINGL